MRTFFSYGPIITSLNYYVPREALIEQGCRQMLGDDFEKGGHYITVWAPRQRGKSWVMQQVLWRLQKDERLNVVKLNLEHLKMSRDVIHILRVIARELAEMLDLPPIPIQQLDDFYAVFKQTYLKKPLILILDEFDALAPEAISGMAGVFRNIYNQRRDDPRPAHDKQYLLHGVALIGVRAVLGVENETGSPFNVQRSLHIANLTEVEVNQMYRDYERESGQTVEQAVVDRIYYETRGQPGLVSWLGELLTETYAVPLNEPITVEHFRIVYAAALNVLPNNNILNIISKAKKETYRELVLELFETNEKMLFKYDDERINFLYLNGVVDYEAEHDKHYLRFPSPFVQKRLFNYFAGATFQDIGKLYGPFEDLDPIITEDRLNVPNLLRRYEQYFKQNRSWLLKDVPRRKTDLRLYEAVYHFNLYAYTHTFLRRREGQVLPEFPTGNGKVDLIIRYVGQTYAIEVKSFRDAYGYRLALKQAARYGHELGLTEITLALFVEAVDDTNRNKFEAVYEDEETGVTVRPIFVETDE